MQPYTRGANGSTIGHDFDLNDDGIPDNPLPPTTGQSNGTPNAIRWAYGQLTIQQPEFAWVKIKVTDPTAVTNASGCPEFKLDTFGGDAGGDSGGKDHIWRYYDPNSLTNNLCLTVGKPATRDIVKVGDTFQYKVKVYNLSNFDMHDVVVTDLLPSGVSFISSVPSQNSGPNPLVWNVGNLPIGKSFSALVTVKATSSGVLENKITVTAKDPANTPITTTATEKTVSGSVPLLVPFKSVSPTAIAPGGTVQWTINIKNVGSGPSGSPTAISEYLPAGFTYQSLNSVTVNGASYTGSTTVGGTATVPTFSVPTGINANSELLLTFTAKANAGIASGSYCNSFDYTQNGIRQTTGALACVTVGGGRIGDTVFRDWNNNGIQDPGEEGIAGVTVTLSGTSNGTAVTDANGNYLFTGLTAGNYTVQVTSGIPAGYTLTTANNPTNVTLATNEQRLNVDFGYRPGGSGSIGDLVYKDIANDGIFNGSDAGIPNVNVWLYEDTNGNGAIDIGDLKIMTATTNASGIYSFSGLATGLSYIVDVDETDPDMALAFTPNTFTASTPALQPVPNLSGVYLDADFGYFPNLPSSIGDQVFIDANNNGLYDSGETLLPGVTVNLYRDENGDGIAQSGELAATTSTNITGTYTFGALGPGPYIVVVDNTDPEIPGGYAPSISQFYYTLTTNQNVTTADFPFVPLINKQVSKTKVNPGETLYYTITANYPGSELLSGVNVTDSIPAGATYVAASANAGGVYSATTNSISWPIGSNTAGDPAFAGSATGSNSFRSTQDTKLQVNNPINNYGGDTTIQIKANDQSERRTLVKFSLSGLAGQTVSSATLRFYVNNNGSANTRIDVYPVSRSWDSTGTTWVKATAAANWTKPGGDYNSANLLGSFVPSTNNQYYTISGAAVNALVQSWINSGATNYGVMLVMVGDSDEVQIRSVEASVGQQPELVVTTGSGTTTLNPSQDTHIRQDSPTNNYATTNPLSVLNAAGEQRGIVQWDLSSLPAGAQVVNASVKFYFTGGNSNVKVNLFRINKTWAQASASWMLAQTASPWTLPGGDYNTSLGNFQAPAANNTYQSYSSAALLSLVQGWVDGSITNQGIELVPTSTATNQAATFASSENASLLFRPELVVTYVSSVINQSVQTKIPIGSAGGQDTYFDVNLPGTNYGDATTINVKTSDASERRALVHFNLSGLSGQVASSATLTFTVNNATANGRVDVYPLTQAFVETQASWNNAATGIPWTTAGGDYNSGNLIGSFIPSTTGVYNISGAALTDLVQNWIDVGADNFGLILVLRGIVDDVQIRTREQAAPDQPKLGVTTGSGTTALISDADTYLRQDQPTNNFGTATAMIALRSGDTKRALVQWDLSAYQPDVTVTAATMRFNVNTTNANMLVSIRRSLQSWDEGNGTNGSDADWLRRKTSTPWSNPGGDYSDTTIGTFTPSATGWVDISNPAVIALVQGWLDGSIPNNGIFLIGTGTASQETKFNSTGTTDNVLAPQLVFTFNANSRLNTLSAGPSLVSNGGTIKVSMVVSQSQLSAAGGSVDTRIAASSDDVEQVGPTGTCQGGPGNVYRISTDLELTADLEPASCGVQTIGLRFNGVTVPKGATVTNAYITFRAIAPDAPNTNNGATDLVIRGQAADNATTFTTALNNVTSRITTTASTAWSSVPAWTTGTNYNTPDIKSVVQEIVNRGGWVNGNSMVFIISGTGSRSADSYDGNAATAPLLHIDWQSPPAYPTDPVTPTLTYTPTNGVTLTPLTGPVPASAVVTGTGTLFTWTFQANANGNIGDVTFYATATDGTKSWGKSTSNSVLITPPFTFRAVATGAVDPVENRGYIQSDVIIQPTPSNKVQTAILASIGDTVFADLDGNGSQGAGEAGLSGVQVCATPTGGGATTCATTDGNGNYRIFGLTAQDYTVTLTPATIPAGYLATTPTVRTVTGANFTSTNNYYSDADFGLRPPGGGSIGDTIWLDANENGAVDGSETGLPGITVQLYDAAGTNLLATTTTNASGLYTFTGLYAGTYKVQVVGTSVVTTSYGITSTLTGAMDLVSVAGITTTLNNPLAVTLPTDTSAILTADFGFNWSGKIGDLTFYDNNGNGIYEPGSGETPAPKVTQVLFYDADGSGTVSGGDPIVAVVETDINGYYLVENLPPGKYVMDPDEQTVESPVTPGLYMTMITSTPETIAFTLGTGPGQSMTNLNVDSGFIERAIVEGYVFHDVNSNGLKDGGEPGLPLVSVTISGTDIANNPVNITIDTDPTGEYKFIVPPGTYTISYNTADGDIPASLGTQTTPTNTTFTALAGAEYSGSSFDFGLDNTGAIGDRVWNDANGNGVQNSGEPGLPGVTVQLYASNGITLLATTVTTGTGGYLFPGLADGTYVVKVVTSTVPLNYNQTFDADGLGTPHQSTVTISGIPNLLQDFGYQLATPTFTVSGTIFEDANGNSLDDDGLNITGVNVTLVYTPSGGSPTTLIVPVDGNGDYSVSGIPQGSNIAISVDKSTLPSPAFVATTPNLLTITNITSNQTNKDFGFQQQFGTIAGKVCDGSTGSISGQCEVGESPLTGVTVTLLYAGTDGLLNTSDDVTQTLTTNASGYYTFTNLLPGLYQITEINPANYISLADADGGNPDNISPVNLTAGQTITKRDFEDAPLPSVIAGGVYNDLNGNGVKDGGEPGLPGVLITLSNGLTTTTNASGLYTFTLTVPGTYTVTETNPAGFTSTGDTQGPNDDQIVVTATPGQTSSNNNFLDVQRVSLTGTVFDDANGSQVQNSGELGTNAGGLVVNLLDSSGITVVATTTVTANGLYTFTSVTPNTTYTLQLTTNPGTPGQPAPAVALPSNWVTTGENTAGTPDGTPNSLLTAVVATSNVTQKNFGIEQLPDSTPVTAPSQPNPGGTISVTVPALSGTDPEDGALTAGTGLTLTLVTTPTNGTLYYDNLPVTPGQVITNYDPTKLTVDPVDGAVTVTFTYAVTDAAGETDPTPATVSMPFGTLSLTGTVFDDADGSQVQNGLEPGTNAGGLNVNLLDSSNNVVATTPVDANGLYTFTTVDPNTNYTLQLNTVAGTIGQPAPTVVLPTNWVTTGENDDGTPDGTPNSLLPVSVGTTDVTEQNFGIEQLPNSNPVNAASQPNPGGTISVTVPALSGTDPEDGPLTAGTGLTLTITSLPINGTLYYDNVPVAPNQVITNYDPAKLTVDPVDGSVVVNFTYAVHDAAGKVDPTPASVSIPFGALTLTGTVFDDADGSQVQNGAESGTDAGGLNVNLLDSSGTTVVETTPVDANGLYTFTSILPNTTYVLQLTTNAGTPTQSAPAVALPSGWVTTGENTAGTPDGTPNSLLTAVVVTSDVTQKNFGIEQLPESDDKTALSQPNPGGTVRVTVPTLSGNDPEDGPLGTGMTLTVVTTPTNGTLYYNGVVVTPNQVITNYDPTKLTVDPDNGAVTVTFTYAVTDAAGQSDPTPATVTMPFDTPDFVVTKTLNTPSPVRKGETVSFTIRITNTGSVTLTTVPLRDTYIDGLIVYVSGTPTPDVQTSGLIEWNDLTAATANGFGRDLGIGDHFEVVVTFVGLTDTSELPGGVAINTATVHDASYDPDGPGGNAPYTVIDKSATAGVGITNPTAVDLAGAGVSYGGAQAALRWSTASESNVLGFHIYRRENGGELVKLTGAMIPAQKPGQSDGAAYSYMDASIETGKSYAYVVEFIGADGPLGQADIGGVFTGGRIFLPAVGR